VNNLYLSLKEVKLFTGLSESEYDGTIDFKNLMKGSAFECRHSRTVVKNLLGMMAEKNLFLSSRLELVTKKTTRAKFGGLSLTGNGEEKATENRAVVQLQRTGGLFRRKPQRNVKRTEPAVR
jgi:hypothetical protein